MSVLDVRLLGEFQLLLDGTPVTAVSGDRPQSLLAYLVLRRRAPQSRQHLAFTLWPDSNEKQARTNLRNLLHTLRRMAPFVDDYLVADSLTLQWRSDGRMRLDVADFETNLRLAQQSTSDVEAVDCLTRAVACYRDDLLPGHYDEWLIPLREELRQRYLDALASLVTRLEQLDDATSALRYSHRLLQLDSLNEAAYVQQMRLLAARGDRAGIRRVYDTCVATLRRELDVDPAPATQAAYERLIRLDTAAGAATGRVSGPATPPAGRPRPLPIPATPFIGRERELAELAQLLAADTCRLLTLLGPGGMGKSRLALQSAAGHQTVFADGVAYVSLTPLRSPDLIVLTVAEALGFKFAGPADLTWQLLHYLRDRHLLLVLDNFEHLLGGAPLLADILAHAPAVKIMTTSRERLNLSGEWVIEVPGLPVPEALGDVAPEANSAVQLFLQGARRVRHGFALTGANRATVREICRRVYGMPLGIELAASWVRALSCAEIAAEIAHSLDFLAVDSRDVAERHRSMRAVFQHSWQQLTEEEQQILKRLSVFRGPFSRAAAREIAGAQLAELSGLADKSLLHRADAGRFVLHELIRQFAAEQLEATPEDESATQARHAVYYVSFLEEQEPALQGAGQRGALADLNPKIDNIRAAWEYAVAFRRYDLLVRAAWPMWYFYELRNYFQEGQLIMAAAAGVVRAELNGNACDERAAAQARLLGDVLAHQAFFLFRTGRNREALALLDECIALIRPLNEPALLAHALAHRGLVCWFLGRFDDAEASLREGVPLSRSQAHSWQVPLFTAFLGVVLHEQGQYDEAYAELSQAMAACWTLGDPRLITFTSSYLSRTAQVLDRHEDMPSQLARGLALARETEDRFGIGLMLERLAVSAHLARDADEARRLFDECLALFKDIGDPWSLARAQMLRGQLEAMEGDPCQAHHLYRQALNMAVTGTHFSVALEALAQLAELCAADGDTALALKMARHVYLHPATPHGARVAAETLRRQLAGREPTLARRVEADVCPAHFHDFVAALVTPPGGEPA